MEFELLNIESIHKQYTHPIKTSSSWGAITGHVDYARCLAAADKFARREDLDDHYMLFMHDGETVLCTVQFTPNMKHKYTGKEVFQTPLSRRRSKKVRSATASRGSRSARPTHLRTGTAVYQDIAYIDFLGCYKHTAAYKRIRFRPASHLVLHRMAELLASIDVPYVYLTVLAEELRPSALYRFYEAMGFICYPFDIDEYRASYPYLFARLSPAKRKAQMAKIRAYHRRVNSNNAVELQMSCGYMVATTEELLEKLTASVHRAEV